MTETMRGTTAVQTADTGADLVGAGWLAHSGWDLAHHRADRVVPRRYSEWCGVLDLVVGISMILLL